MRNIAIADRKDWVFSHPAPPPPPRSTKLRDTLATIPILLLIPALIVPFFMTSAATPTLRIRPEAPTPGTEVTITGSDFERIQAGHLHLRGARADRARREHGSGVAFRLDALSRGPSIDIGMVGAVAGVNNQSAADQIVVGQRVFQVAVGVHGE